MPRIMVFVDGENLLLRYEAMVESGRTPRSIDQMPRMYADAQYPIEHIKGRFVWTAAALGQLRASSARVHYYTTFSGGNGEIESFSAQVAKFRAVEVNPIGPGEISIPTLIPRTFQKTKSDTKTKSVDINICVDALEYVRQHAMDIMYLVSGDIDYLPLIAAVMRAGVRVRLAGFSSGLAGPLTYSADHFECLDGRFLS